MFIEILTQQLEDQNHVFSEWELMLHSHNSVLVRGVFLLELLKNLVLLVCVLKVELLVPAYFESYLP